MENSMFLGGKKSNGMKQDVVGGEVHQVRVLE